MPYLCPCNFWSANQTEIFSIMNIIRLPFFELLKITLSPHILEDHNHYVPPEHILKVQQQLREVDSVNVNQTGCCISIHRDKFGSLYATNIWGYVEDVLGRRICIETDNADKISDADALVIVLLGIIYSGYGMHKYNDDSVVMQWFEKGITMPKFHSYSCLADLAWEIKILDLLPVIAEHEGPQHRDRIPIYIDCVQALREIDTNFIDANDKPIYLEKDEGEYDLYIFGEPEADSFETMSVRPIQVYSEPSLSKEEVLFYIIRKWSFNGATLDQPEPFHGFHNYLGITAQVLQEDIRRGFIKGKMPSPYELQTLKFYQNIERAYDILSKHLGKRYSFKPFLDRCVDIHSFRIATTDEVDVDERIEFFDKVLSTMKIPELEYNSVILMVATAPSTPITNGMEKLRELYRKHIHKEGVHESACYHGYLPFSGGDETGRAVLYIFTLITTPTEGTKS